MSYEYKELIEQAIIDDDRPLDWEEGFKELDEVYAQAAKADEYEAKAVAFDLIREAMDYHYPSAHDRKYLNGYQHPKASLKDIDAIINSYESGESEC